LGRYQTKQDRLFLVQFSGGLADRSLESVKDRTLILKKKGTPGRRHDVPTNNVKTESGVVIDASRGRHVRQTDQILARVFVALHIPRGGC
jgi:hypothetical protein